MRNNRKKNKILVKENHRQRLVLNQIQNWNIFRQEVLNILKSHVSFVRFGSFYRQSKSHAYRIT